MDNKLKQFLIGLDKLSRETGYVICGCGCCSSPFLVKEKPENMTSEAGYCSPDKDCMGDINWTGPKSTMWDRDKKKIIKLSNETTTDKI